MTLLTKQKIEPKELEEFCLRESSQAEYERIDAFYQQAKQRNIQSMLELEELLTQILIKSL